VLLAGLENARVERERDLHLADRGGEFAVLVVDQDLGRKETLCLLPVGLVERGSGFEPRLRRGADGQRRHQSREQARALSHSTFPPRAENPPGRRIKAISPVRLVGGVVSTVVRTSELLDQIAMLHVRTSRSEGSSQPSTMASASIST